MARIRTIKPEFLEDEKTAALSDAASRLFTAMILLADDHGNVRADVRWLCGQVWWAHNSPPNVLRLLIELTNAPLIRVYGVRNGTYATIINWTKHQRIDNAGKPRVPVPNDPDVQEIDLLRGESPQFAANLGETPPDPDPDPDPERRTPSADPAAGRRVKARNRSAKGTEVPLPGDWQPTPEHLALATERGVSLANEERAFRLHAEANDRRCVRWNAAFSMWLVKSRAGQQSRQTPFDLQMERVRQFEAEERALGGGEP